VYKAGEVCNIPAVLFDAAELDQIEFLFVDPIYHGRGLGSLLLTHAQTAARAAHDALAVLATEKRVIMGVRCIAANPAGVRTYSRKGFVPQREEEDQGLMTVWMEWEAPREE
jgi:GNAT superfamily N-acetyltransferase